MALHLILSCIVPNRWGGSGGSAILIDNDSHLHLPSLCKMLRNHYRLVSRSYDHSCARASNRVTNESYIGRGRHGCCIAFTHGESQYADSDIDAERLDR